MKLFVLMKDGRPFELPAADAETVNRLMDYDDGVDAVFAFASTNKGHVKAMMNALPDLLDWDNGGDLSIAEFTLG
jgi:hypothetical protein